MASESEYDIAIIGGGAAGLSVAAGAVQLGARTALINEGLLGGECLYSGCVPSKSLIHTAKFVHAMSNAASLGLENQSPSVDMAAVMASVRQVISHIEPHDSPERFRSLGVDVILDVGRFISPDRFEAAGQIIRARKYVIATGSRPAIPPIEGLMGTPFLTNETLFSLSEPVPHLLILGGGPIGCEIAQAFKRLGSRVTVFSSNSRLLPREDEDLSNVVHQSFIDEGIELLLGVEVLGTARHPQGVKVSLKTSRGTVQLTGSHLLVAAGRRPNLENLGLDKANVERKNGRLLLDQRLRTTNPNIYACGDVAGPFLFTHMAEHQAGVVLKNALFHWPAKAETKIVPWCTFTDPELARVGLSEVEAKSKGKPHQVYRFDFRDIDRAETMRTPEGFAKIVADPRGRILGAAIVGPQAGELIHEYVLAMRAGLRLSDISNTIHIYPTLAQINRKVADMRLKAALTPFRRKVLKVLFRLRGKP